MLDSEYKSRIDYAAKAVDEFFETIEKTGKGEMLKNDKHIIELFFKALDVTTPASEEEKDFYHSLSGYLLFKHIFVISHWDITTPPNTARVVTEANLKTVYSAMCEVIDDAIELNDKYKQDYLKIKEDMIAEYNEALKKYGFTIKKSGCYIATAVYGSYDCPQVWTLRRYRDKAMARHFCGRMFIRIYYFISPTLVKKFGGSQWFIHLWRGVLDAIVGRLLMQGYEDTPYTDSFS